MPTKRSRKNGSPDGVSALGAVVGLLASSERLEPCLDLLRAVDRGGGLCIIVVQPQSDGLPPVPLESLASVSQLEVVEVRGAHKLVPDTILIVPPDMRARLEQGSLHVRSAEGVDSPASALNQFFNSLSQPADFLPLAVILSRREDTELPALEAIRAEGGVTFASPLSQGSQTLDGPLLGPVDYLLDPAEIGLELQRLAGRLPAHRPTGPEGATGSEYVAKILQLLRQQTGVDFNLYKQATVGRRIWRRMLLHHASTLEHYYQVLRQSPDAIESLHDDLLIAVTDLFRDSSVFEAMHQQVFPAVVQNSHPGQPIRVWVPGCAKGDEAYSVAIGILEAMSEQQSNRQVQIFATDVNERALERARVGLYPESLPTDIGGARVERFFQRVEKGYQISKPVRDLCLFARQDLTQDPPFSRLDLITCRNVLIYLVPALQYKILRIFHYALKPGGFLVLGASESVGRAGEFFVEVDRGSRIFARKGSDVQSRTDLFEVGPNSPRSTHPVPFTAPGPLLEVQKEADRLVLSRYGPPGVIVDKDLEIVQFRGRTGLFLENPPGTVTHSLFKLAREGLLSELRAAMQQVTQTGMPVSRSGLKVRSNQDWLQLDLEVHSISALAPRQRYYLILFKLHEGGQPEALEVSAAPVQSESEMLRLLREELDATREYLNATTQEQEVTLEILQAAHEELQSANEELQSTNEELETAKEELQSTNEELTTVNEELHKRNLDLTKVNNDLNNLLSSVSLPVIILGSDLRIRRFTPVARQVLKVIPSDVGRPIGDLRPLVEIDDLEARIREVLDNLCPQQFETQDREGRWYSVRIRPYRTHENRIDGVVLAFVDVDQARRGMDDARQSRELARGLLEAVDEPALLLDRDLRLLQVNQLFCRTFELTEESVVGELAHELSPPLWQSAECHATLRRAFITSGRLSWSSPPHRAEVQPLPTREGATTLLVRVKACAD